MYTKEFLRELHEAYSGSVVEAVESGSGIAGRYLDDNTSTGIHYTEVLAANSLEELQAKARKIALQNKVYSDFMSGKCYETEETRRKQCGCPRLYAQANNDEVTLKEFFCAGVGYIPSCPKFGTNECWERFDSLGLKMK